MFDTMLDTCGAVSVNVVTDGDTGTTTGSTCVIGCTGWTDIWRYELKSFEASIGKLIVLYNKLLFYVYLSLYVARIFKYPDSKKSDIHIVIIF
jgi:hypothetical protein